MSKRSRLSLIISGALIISCSVLASGFPTTLSNLTGDFYSQVSAVLGVKAEAAPIVFADDVVAVNSFHFLPPIAPVSGDSSKFDPKLLKQLKVEVCEVKSNGDCTLIKTFTNNSAGSEQLRIEKSYYVANWDTAYQYPNNRTYRIEVSLPLLLLGSVDLTPDVYTRFGRTWPIKFLIEKDPVLRVRQLRSLGRSAASIANALKTEFNLTREQIIALLLGDVEPFTQEEIDVALDGIFQNVIVKSTTKIADEDTNSALTSYDPSSGRMAFGVATGVLKNLRSGDVLAGEPTPVAPYGYLRKVTSIRKNGGGYIVDTAQGTIKDAIYQGALIAKGQLKAADAMSSLQSGSRVSPNSENSNFGSSNVGDGFEFHRDIDITMDLANETGDVTGSGTVHLQGFVDFNASYDLGVGVETCTELPPICVDRVEAHVNVEQKSHVKVDGRFDGHINKEKTIDTIPFSPITFFIGPIPVIIVPVINVNVGVDGTAHVNFVFEAEANSKFAVGAKWTDPGDGGSGWEHIKELNPLGGQIIQADVSGKFTVEGFGKAEAKLLLYGIAGPGMGARFGARLDVETGRNPFWTLEGHFLGDVNFSVDIAGIIDLGSYSETIVDLDFWIADSPNQDPMCDAAATASYDIKVPKLLGPRASVNSLEGFFYCTDPEGESLSYSAESTKDGQIATNVAAITYAFQTSGKRTVTVTARDQSGGEKVFSIEVTVFNALPVVTISPSATNNIQATVQLFLVVTAYDPESGNADPRQGFLACDKINFQASAGGTATKFGVSGTCGAEVIFSQTGPASVLVTAVDPEGEPGSVTFNINVTAAPANPAPKFDRTNFLVWAQSGPTSGNCVPGLICVAPNNADLYNGEAGSGEYVPPLLLDIGVLNDPNGDPIQTPVWHCVTGGTEVVIGFDSVNGYPSCDPAPSPNGTVPSFVFAEITDGTTTVRSPVFMYHKRTPLS